MKKLILIILIISITVACEKKIVGPVIDANILLAYRNANGEDILDPNSVDAIKAEDIDVFVLKNGVKTRLYQGNLDASEFFKIKQETQGNYIMMFYFDIAEENFNGDKITQLIRYKDGTEDELVGEFNSDRKRNKILQQVWVNGVLKRALTSTNRESIIIVK